MQTNLKKHLAGELLTTATCWKLTLAGGEVMGFTDYDEDLEVVRKLVNSSIFPL